VDWSTSLFADRVTASRFYTELLCGFHDAMNRKTGCVAWVYTYIRWRTGGNTRDQPFFGPKFRKLKGARPWTEEMTTFHRNVEENRLRRCTEKEKNEAT